MLFQRLRRCSPAERLAGSTVEGGGYGVEVIGAVSREVGSPREVLAQQTVGVFAGAALPGALRVAEIDLEAGVDAQLGVLGHLGALVPGERAAQLLGQRRDRRGDRVADSFGAVAGERGPVLLPRLAAVALHARQGQQ